MWSGHTNSTWTDQHSSQGLPEPKALSNYYVWMVFLSTCELSKQTVQANVTCTITVY